jgi:hypothetical protein
MRSGPIASSHFRPKSRGRSARADQDRHADGEREHRDPLQVLDERAAEAAELVLEQ